jgi:hypothetical protein
MTLLVPWLLFPLVMAVLSLGCGLLLERVAGTELPASLLLPAGFVVVSLAAQFALLSESTAELATPGVVALAAAGVGLSPQRWRRRRYKPWWIASAVGVFAVFAAPVVRSGRATFAGYIKLDDTATYLAMLDRFMEHGYAVSGLAPSTYEATLETSLVYGYPMGSLVPLGVGRALVRQDAAWLWQPYLAFLAALLALALYHLVSGLVRSPLLRALVAFVGAQAALLFGYALWGGIKELSTAVIVALIAALVPRTLSGQTGPRAIIALAAACAGLVGVLSLGGAAWLAPLLGGALLIALRGEGVGSTFRTSATFALTTAFLAIPSLVAATTWLRHSGGFTSGSEYGNLQRRLSWLQVFGIWPNGDFRVPPNDLDATHALIAVVGLAVVTALVLAWRLKAWELLLALAAAAFACAVYVGAGSPWIGGKALASSSPLLLAAGIAGPAAVYERGRRVEGVLAAGFIIAGVLWSNALQYREAYLAPRPRLAELATIGHRLTGQGPTLMTEYEAYGARHFLRSMDPEAASELRRHFINLRAGGVADTGVSPDIDEIRLDSVLYYKTLVLRRSGVNSRPPSVYQPVWRGHYYEAWQRPSGPNPILEHLPLGSRFQPAAVPPCSDILRLARLAAANGGILAAVTRPPAIVIEPSGSIGAPTSFGAYGEDPGTVYLTKAQAFALPFAIRSSGTYGIWVGGSFRSGLVGWVDGRRVGSDRDELSWPGNFLHLGDARLRVGPHTLRLRYTGPDLLPGSAGAPGFGIGPFGVAKGTEDRPVTYVQPVDARSLCGKSLDWVEALRA